MSAINWEGRRWTAQEEQLAVSMAEDGMSYDDIAAELNRTRESVACRVRLVRRGQAYVVARKERKNELRRIARAELAAIAPRIEADGIDYQKKRHSRNVAGSAALLKRLRLAHAMESRQVQNTQQGSVPFRPRFVELETA